MTFMSRQSLADETPDSSSLLDGEQRQPCEVWTRVMGYHRPLSSFNRGKQGEHHERVCFRESRVQLD